MTMNWRCYLKDGLEGPSRGAQSPGLGISKWVVRKHEQTPLLVCGDGFSGRSRCTVLLREVLIGFSVAPHAIEDDGQLSGHCDQGALF